jgi:hypothetical protein
MAGLRALSAVFCVFILVGCAAQAQRTADTLERGAPITGEHRILLMPIDVELSELQASGLLEPKADWTEQARTHLTAALDDSLKDIEARLIRMDQVDPDYANDDLQVQLMKLNEAVGMSIMFFQYQTTPVSQLPTKKDSFDWTLGPDVRYLRDKYNADYALHVFIRDSYSSGGRTALIVFGVLLGVGIPGGAQVGFASLVDLETGKVVWFNRLLRPEGDLRTAEAARASTDVLMTSFPQ